MGEGGSGVVGGWTGGQAPPIFMVASTIAFSEITFREIRLCLGAGDGAGLMVRTATATPMSWFTHR